MKYLLTVRLEFEAADDVAAREALLVDTMREAAERTETELLSAAVQAKTTPLCSAKLQRLNANKPPRPLAAWSSEK